MPTPPQGYFNAAGERIPGTTTIIGRFKESGALVHWAWKLGMEGKDYREVRDRAADAGTAAHAMMEAHIRKQQFDPTPFQPDILAKARKAFGAFKEWAADSQFEITDTEVRGVSEKYQFGGTQDACLIRGKRAVGDWKTSNAVYSDYLLQLAAYGIIWDENHPDDKVTGGYHLIRFDKEYGDFAHFYFGSLTDAKRMFIHLRAAYDLDKRLRARVR
jgi:hypothetical protein